MPSYILTHDLIYQNQIDYFNNYIKSYFPDNIISEDSIMINTELDYDSVHRKISIRLDDFILATVNKNYFENCKCNNLY